jgi:NAD(P) transhydrogenase
MADYDYDLVVIGSGPGGEGAAMKAAKNGLRVAVIERHTYVGGGCTHWGTIPSKALRHAVQMVGDFRTHQLFAGQCENLRFELPEMMRNAQSVVRRQVSMRESFYERNRVPIVQGHGSFVDPHTLQISNGPVDKTITFEQAVIATGSRPWRPDDIDFDHPRIFDADTILGLDFTPQTMAIYGAGVIGSEYATMFRNLDIKVNLINTREKLLEFLDDEIIDALAYHMRDQGTLIRHNEHYERVEGVDDGVILHLKSGKKIKTDVFLWANGRAPNTDKLGMDKLEGAEMDKRGRIRVDENFCVPPFDHVYAVGDVIGPPGLASASYDQGRFAATHVVNDEVDYHLVQDVPTGIYTSPEISSVGKTERELTEQAVPYEVGHSLFRSLARAQISGRTVGMLKILFHRETLEILGIHCFGESASEIVHIGQAIMFQPPPNNTLMYFVNTTFNYPTMAEGYRVAALNGLNRLF